MPKRAVAGLAAALVLAAGACSSSSASGTSASPTSNPSPTTAAPATAAPATAAPATSTTSTTLGVFPDADWERADAAAVGIDPAKLQEIAQQAEDAGSNCFAVTRHGKLVGLWTWNGKAPEDNQEVFSATKSYTSTLVGIAQAEGKLDIDDKASKYITEWVGTPSEDVTIRDLLSNDSGRHYDTATDYTAMAVEASDKTAASIALGQDAPPGTVWAYNNSAIQTLSRVLEVALGESPSDYAQRKLFAPIGMDHSVMKKDASGHTMTFMGLSSTCLDMARFGYLILRQGNWNGTQVVPREWVRDATNTSQNLNDAYGYLWWLNKQGHVLNPLVAVNGADLASTPVRQMVPEAPESMFWALGLGNQIIAIDPASDTVVVRLGGARGKPGVPTFTQADAARVVTEALADPAK